MHHVLAKFTIRADARGRFDAAMKENLRRSALEPGCIRFEAYEDRDAPDQVWLVEIWRSERDLTWHLEQTLTIATARRTAAAGSQALLVVRDSGSGMSSEVRARIFEPFFTTKGPGAGTGLGLAVVHGIVEQSKGTIEVESEPGRGTTFLICLPLVEAEVPLPEKREIVRSTPPDRCGNTILLVEDDPGVRAFLRQALEASGYQVRLAMDGEQATGILADARTKIDLVLTDVVMPGMSGHDLAHLVDERPRRSRDTGRYARFVGHSKRLHIENLPLA